MTSTGRTIAGQIMVRDSEMNRFSVSAIVEKIRVAKALAGVNRIFLWPHHDDAVNRPILRQCRKLGIEAYLWYPVLADNEVIPEKDDLTMNAWGGRGNGASGLWKDMGQIEETFTFACPRSEDYLRLIMARFEKMLSRDRYDGVLIDRVRFPTPTNGAEAVFSCFCPWCAAAEPRIPQWRDRTVEMRSALESATDANLERWGTLEGMFEAFDILELFRFREKGVAETVGRFAAKAAERGLDVGVDLFSPAITLLAGQDYGNPGAGVRWIKPRLYFRTRGPSGLPGELPSLARGLMHWAQSLSMPALMAFFGRSLALDLPENFYAIEESGCDPNLAFREIAKAREIAGLPIIPSFDLVVHPDFQTDTDEDGVLAYVNSASDCPGLVLAWNMLYIPERFLKIVGDNVH